jgi:hypothetical protein
MKSRIFFTVSLITIVLVSCAPEVAPLPSELSKPTSTLTSTPSPTDTPTSTQTLVPTATPYGGGRGNPRFAIFTELEPDDSTAGYIRIGEVDINKEKLVFSNSVILRVGTKPGNLNFSYHDLYPPLVSWSPDGNYLAYTWFEDGKALLYVYDHAADKLKWQLELKSNRPSSLHFNIDWSADSDWAFIGVDTNSYYILNVRDGIVSTIPINKQIQITGWDATQPILYFGEMWVSLFYQYDPATNQISLVDPPKFDPTQFEKIGSYSTYGQYNQDNDGYLFEASNEDNSRSYYLGSPNDPIFELLRIGSDVTRDELSTVYKIIPSPDKAFYLVGGGTNLPFNNEYNTYFTSIALSPDHPMTITSIDSVNGIYPFSWSPDGKSYIGYQYALKTGNYYIPLVKLVIVDAATNSISKEYDIEFDNGKANYGFFLHTMLMDSTGPVGIDVYWP